MAPGADSVLVSVGGRPCIIPYIAISYACLLTRFSPTQAVLPPAKFSVKRLPFSPNAFASRISTKRHHTSRSPQGAGHTRGRFSDNCWRVRALHAKMPDREGHLSPSQLHQFITYCKGSIIHIVGYSATVATTYFWRCRNAFYQNIRVFYPKTLADLAQKPKSLQNKQLSTLTGRASGLLCKRGKNFVAS